MNILPAIKARWSAKKFLPRPVSGRIIERILTAGRLAPSAKNRQEWRFVVVTRTDLRSRLADAAFGAEQMLTAPVSIAVCTTNIDYRMPNGQLSYPVDLSLAAGFMLLQATHEGLGSCAITTFDEQEVQDLLSIPHAMRVVIVVALGYTDQKPPVSSRKPLADIVAYEHW
jgi:nitroreductase